MWVHEQGASLDFRGQPLEVFFHLGAFEHMVGLFGILLYLLSQFMVPVTHFSGFPILCLFHISSPQVPWLASSLASEAQLQEVQPDLPC